MNSTTNTEMLNAFELFHYAWKFRTSRFILAIEPPQALSSLLADLQLLQRAHIPTLLICSKSSLPEAGIAGYSERGLDLSPLLLSNPVQDSLTDLLPNIETLLLEMKIPVLLLDDQGSDADTLLQVAECISTAISAEKTFYLNSQGSLTLDGESVSQIPRAELLQKAEATSNMAPRALQTALAITQNENQDFVFLPAESGMLFTELFTHRGAGTLISDAHSNSIRAAKLSDVYDILLLMNPAMVEGSILHYSEAEIVSEIASFYVYAINGSVIATAKLGDYGEAAELGKFCTLPRYRGKGRARKLARFLAEEAKKQGKKYVFGLSTSEEMWDFFLSLGFVNVERETLPSSWKQGYDFARPSKAFRLDVKKD